MWRDGKNSWPGRQETNVTPGSPLRIVYLAPGLSESFGPYRNRRSRRQPGATRTTTVEPGGTRSSRAIATCRLTVLRPAVPAEWPPLRNHIGPAWADRPLRHSRRQCLVSAPALAGQPLSTVPGAAAGRRDGRPGVERPAVGTTTGPAWPAGPPLSAPASDGAASAAAASPATRLA